MSTKFKPIRIISKYFLILFFLIIGLTSTVSAAPEKNEPKQGSADDGDGIDPALDNCILTFNPDQEDSNGDGIGDACDLDNDSIENRFDNCPFDSNPGQEDGDGNGAGDACDNGYDLDMDGILDSLETTLMNQFAPVVFLHSDDYDPAGVEWLFTRSDAPLVFDFGSESACNTDEFEGLSTFSVPIDDGVNLLGINDYFEGFLVFPFGQTSICETNLESSGPDGPYGHHFYIDMVETPGSPDSIYNGNLESAPFYTTVSRNPTEGTYAINYWFYYAWNGCGWDGAEVEYCNWTHEGDWEHVTVYVRPNPDGSFYLSSMLFYYHGDYHGYWPADIELTPDGRPVVYSALYTHASYNHSGKIKSCVREDLAGTCWVYRTDYTMPGIRWDPLNQITTFIGTGVSTPMDLPQGGIINIGQKPLTRSKSYFDPSMGVPMPSMEWILYQGKWGKDGNSPPGPGTPNFQWYENQSVDPPAIWKVPDQPAAVGVPTTFEIGKIYDNSNDLSLQVDWGDGTIIDIPWIGNNDYSADHTYAAPGEYFVEITAVENVTPFSWQGNVFKVTVAHPPTVTTPIPDLTVTEDAPDSSIDLWLYFEDQKDSDSLLVYSIKQVSDWSLFDSVSIPDNQYLILDYTPDIVGTADITIRATNTAGLTVDDTFKVTITPVNDAPVGADDGPYPAKAGEQLTVAAPGVLTNDTDVDGDALEAVIDSNPAHGKLTLSDDGAFVYTPDPFYMGPDSFTYHATDGFLSSNLVTAAFDVEQGGTLICDEGTVSVGKVDLIIPAGTISGCVYVNIVPVNGDDGPANPNGLLPLGHRYDIRIRNLNGTYQQLFNPALELCYKYSAKELDQTKDNPNKFQIWTASGNRWQKLVIDHVELTEQKVCAPITHLSYFDLFLPVKPPDTGFAPGVITTLSEQPEEKAYPDLGDLWLEISKLGIQIPIIEVPLSGGDWDVTWLGNRAGWLERTAFPTRDGNSFLTAHVYDANGQPGPFVNLAQLRYGNEIIIHAWGQEYVYKVRSVRLVGADQASSNLKHEDLPWLTLITCKGYNETTNSYKFRVVVRAVQIEIR